MGVESVTTDWAQSQFGDDAAEVTRRVVRAMAAAHRSGLEAQAASGLVKKFSFGSVWSARFNNLVAELHDMPDAEVIKVPGAPYALIKLKGKLLIPFRLATTLSVHFSQAKIESNVLRDLAAVSVPRPIPEPTLFDGADDAESGVGSDELSAHLGQTAVLDEDTPVIYIGVVANADSKSLLAAWWGIGVAQDEHGKLTWSPEELPLHILGPDDVPVRVPQPRSPDQIPAFDQGPVPPVTVTARSRRVEAPAAGDEPPISPASADDRA